MKTFAEYRERFRHLYDTVKLLHETSERPHRGHGLDHDVTVAMLAARIAPDPRTAEKAWCAGMIHSADRIVGHSEMVAAMRHCLSFLPERHFSLSEEDEIFQAAFRHEEPKDDDSLVQQVLMDADRLANIMLSIALRASQWLHDQPAIEFEYLGGKRNPATTWGAPTSALDGVRVVYQMLHPMRTEGGKRLARQFTRELEVFVAGVEGQYQELGLVGIKL